MHGTAPARPFHYFLRGSASVTHACVLPPFPLPLPQPAERVQHGTPMRSLPAPQILLPEKLEHARAPKAVGLQASLVLPQFFAADSWKVRLQEGFQRPRSLRRGARGERRMLPARGGRGGSAPGPLSRMTSRPSVPSMRTSDLPVSYV